MEQKLYDNAINTALINIFTLSKESKSIRLYNFNRYNVEHLALFNVALMARHLFDCELKIDAPLSTIWWLKRKYKCRKDIRRLKKKERGNINCFYFIKDIEEAYKDSHLFRKIYHAYYER